jgi:hypothetical protein
MKKRYLWCGAQIALLILAANFAAFAQDQAIEVFNGVINAYSPQTTTPTATGPYEVRGPWSLRLKKGSNKADFSAALNMELSDGWVLTLGGGNFDPTGRGAHTHHIKLVDADVTWLTTGGFEVNAAMTQMATITLNGSPAPVSPSPLVIEITGGTSVKYSNITLTFGVPGSNHFGTEPLPGVVRSVKKQCDKAR